MSNVIKAQIICCTSALGSANERNFLHRETSLLCVLACTAGSGHQHLLSSGKERFSETWNSLVYVGENIKEEQNRE